MIKSKGIINKNDDYAETRELNEDVEALPTGEYGYLIFDKEKNKALPQLKYLFGYVLPEISKALPNELPVNAIYRFFEELYAPIHVCYINDEKFEYVDLKSEPIIEVNGFIEKIIHHAKAEWGIEILEKNDLKSPDAKAPYTEAYANQWLDYSRKI